MKNNQLFSIIENKVKEEKIIERKYGFEKIPDGEPTFTTSQETDILEMISNEMTIEEILSIIRQW